MKVWDAVTGQETPTLTGYSVAFSPDGRRLASVLRVSWQWESGSGREERMRLVGAGQDVRLWEVSNGREIRRIKGHAVPVNGVAFSPDARMIAA